MKRTILLSLVLILCLTGTALAAPTVVLNGNTLSFDVPPAIEDGRTLVPLRTIFEALGSQIQWDGATQTVTATKDNTEIKLTIGGQAYKNGQPVSLDVPAKITEGRTLVPLRFVSEALGCEVSWDGSTQTITINSASSTGQASQVKVHFMDVGQADAIYIDLPDDNDILIDGGNVGDGQTVCNYLKAQGVDDIELLIVTHPHEDHIGGLPTILDAYRVEKIVDSGKTTESSIYNTYQAKVKTEGAVYESDNYQSYTWGNTALKIYTGSETWEDINDYSVVCRLDTGDIELLFTGDAENPVEATLKGDISAEVLKVGHHGSTSSTSAEFLSRVNPQVAIISVGEGNAYGHPAAETLSKLQASGLKVYRTDLNGNVVFSTDGKTYSVVTQKAAAAPLVVAPASNPIPAPGPANQTGACVGSTKSNKYHSPSCRYAENIAPENQIWFKDATSAQAAGYEPCGVCKP
jgi:competence protein ComEC